MSWLLIEEDVLYKEEVTYSDAYTLNGVYYEEKTSISYLPFYCTDEPYRSGEEAMMLPEGSSSDDARVIYTDTKLLTYDDTGDVSIADKVYLKDPSTERNPPQRYVVMEKEEWKVNSGFQLIQTTNANCYLIIKEEKVIDNGV